MGSDSLRHRFGRRGSLGQNIEYTECVGCHENPESLGAQEVEHGSGSEVEPQEGETLEQAGDDGHAGSLNPLAAGSSGRPA